MNAWADVRSPVLPHAERADADLPPLHARRAHPVFLDRWERVGSTVEIEAPPSTVWSALTEPEAVGQWLAVCRGSLTEPDRDCILDFEDGEFFLCRPRQGGPVAGGGYELRYLWRWLGIGPAAAVTWRLEPAGAGTRVTVTEEAFNPPSDWRTWNGGGWPGILDQLAAFVRTGPMSWRWPWRRMGPYVQVHVEGDPFSAWNQLVNPVAVQFWLQRSFGRLEPGQSMTLVMGDASGPIEFAVKSIVDPGQSFPSYLPSMQFALRREVWKCEVGGQLWIEPAGLGRSLFQVFHYNWENLPPDLQLSERRIVAGFWIGAMLRAQQMLGGQQRMDRHDGVNGRHAEEPGGQAVPAGAAPAHQGDRDVRP